MRAFQGVYTVSITAKNVLNTVAPTGFFLLPLLLLPRHSPSPSQTSSLELVGQPGLTSS